jgi:hypothetical protein
MNGKLVTSAFFEDSSMIWFTTFDAINVYNWKTDCFHHYKIKSELSASEGYYAFYLDPDQNLWLIYDKFLYTFNLRDTTFHKIDVTEIDVNRAVAIHDSRGHVNYIWFYRMNEAGAEQFTLNAKHEIISKEVVWETIASKPSC